MGDHQGKIKWLCSNVLPKSSRKNGQTRHNWKRGLPTDFERVQVVLFETRSNPFFARLEGRFISTRQIEPILLLYFVFGFFACCALLVQQKVQLVSNILTLKSSFSRLVSWRIRVVKPRGTPWNAHAFDVRDTQILWGTNLEFLNFRTRIPERDSKQICLFIINKFLFSSI